ncbi:DUF3313 domain-containing protein [Kumtagia ephedrae]|uniref:DUF3313 domain-containing protein n=1 Tax=Kumtagia ephedrae TaxID=2116701 RepID=A0A2P7RS80_9HYPH|nr:DUF3313 domain-containing protein [Mesorhizobium ephedrae]PSJ53086.1 DUF3313 domain-containing protein [Mesorhizobium ephedrae]
MPLLRTALLALPMTLAIAGCASVPLKKAGTLTSYSNLGVPKGTLSKARRFVDAQGLAAVKTVSIVPTSFAFGTSPRVRSKDDLALVANALDRAICIALSDRYHMVPLGQPADLKVRAVVTDIVPTNKVVAGVSTAVTLASGAFMPPEVPVSVPRLPIGLGGLAVEAEAVDSSGVQRAAIIWARGANSIQNKPRVSEVGDAYGLASTFGNDFSRMLITGKEPKGLQLTLPSGQRIKSMVGGKHKYAACETFGRSPGIPGMVAGKFGAPPQWTDKRPKPAALY